MLAVKIIFMLQGVSNCNMYAAFEGIQGLAFLTWHVLRLFMQVQGS